MDLVNREIYMSDLEDRVVELESTVESFDYTIGDSIGYITVENQRLTEEVEHLKKILGLATSPDAKDQEKFRTLREAYEKYEFTRKLVLGIQDD